MKLRFDKCEMVIFVKSNSYIQKNLLINLNRIHYFCLDDYNLEAMLEGPLWPRGKRACAPSCHVHCVEPGVMS